MPPSGKTPQNFASGSRFIRRGRGKFQECCGSAKKGGRFVEEGRTQGGKKTPSLRYAVGDSIPRGHGEEKNLKIIHLKPNHAEKEFREPISIEKNSIEGHNFARKGEKGFTKWQGRELTRRKKRTVRLGIASAQPGKSPRGNSAFSPGKRRVNQTLSLRRPLSTTYLQRTPFRWRGGGENRG